MRAGALALAVRLTFAAPALLACGGGDAAGPGVSAGATLALTVSNVPALDLRAGGRFEAWIIDSRGSAHSLGPVTVGSGASIFANPVPDPAWFLVTYEPGSDTDAMPSSHHLLVGAFRDGRAELTVRDAVTVGNLTLRERPGQFTMFSPSDNFKNGYPSFEESGIWLFNMAPRETPQNDMWVRLTQLHPGWVYEGWMVRDVGAPNAVWLSYGKFTPDATGAVNSRDDTGWGAFSGVTDFRTAGEEEFPGDDWISNPLGFEMPGGLSLPLNLREKTNAGASRWTHLITIEPSSDRGEAIGEERPFAIRPYRDPFGDGGPGVARTITFRADGVPSGQVVRQ